MAERLITIATCNELTEAHILKGRLEAEGILCFLGDEHIVGAQPFYAVAVGGIKLKVPENDADEAKAILATIQGGHADYMLDEIDLAPPMQEHAQVQTCPRCSSDNITQEKHNKAGFSLRSLLPDFLLSFLNQRYKCYNCGHQWKDK
ncbi:DUF2007 domain-containing protein [Pontibacter sp. 172403-2]|uniref:putative signal transducing protein n=1 Tax=Pontibacter rufus TaxID=2791028 RepID=UPI0018AFC348|nr:DUF2007 domain-containing protein [Pontibacter sp. 172403-2]MBF9253981.1 DUF2007 domain-containing protein [Pontibacter sp. 172403-2]